MAGPGAARSALGGSIVRNLRSTAAATLAASLLATPFSAPRAAAVEPPVPSSVVALGDSITRGFNACGFYVDCTRRSWSTGDDSDVASQRLRLRDLGGAAGQANLARSGARADALVGQATAAVAERAQYVTIEIGANDACRSEAARMTPVEDFRRQIDSGLTVLRSGAPDALVFVASIPDLKRLWEVGHGKWYVRKAWSKLGVCPSMLARPSSKSEADVARRDLVRNRVVAYNAALAAACDEYGPRCRFDRNAVFDTRFTLGQLSRWDFFHPNTSGQRVLADVTWRAGFFTDVSVS